MAEYLTAFANILDDFFRGLSDCGLMTSYMVQLHSSVAGIESMLKFRRVIHELIKCLQSLLSSIPNIQSNEASTQTLEDTAEVVVTCHPISLATLHSAQIVPTSSHKLVLQKGCNEENKDKMLLGSHRMPTVSNSDSPTVVSSIGSHRTTTVSNSDTPTVVSSIGSHGMTTVSNCDSPTVVSSIELCELKPLLIEGSDNFSGLVNLESSVEKKDDTVKVDNIVHIVVEATNNSSESSCDTSDNSIIKLSTLQCMECEKQLKCREELKEHLQNHHSSSQHMHVCDMCDKIFSCVQNLQEHCRRDHNGAGCFLCTICNKRFMTKLSYNRHMDTHQGKKEAVCDICGKAFSRADYLQTHYSIHLGKRNFACSLCPRKFVRSIHLRAHEKVHSGIKDHVCKMCSKAFVRSDKLKEHMLRHLNIKRFQCPICQRYYAEKRDLKVHLNSHSE